VHSAREPFLEELRPRFLLADGGRDLLAFLRHRGKQSLDRENNQYLLEVCLPEKRKQGGNRLQQPRNQHFQLHD